MKFVIPFNDKNTWQHNSKCELCQQIDSQINHILELQRQQKFAEEAITRLELILVDGYNLTNTLEIGGIANRFEIFKTIDSEVDKRIFNYLYDTYLTAYLPNTDTTVVQGNTTYSANFDNVIDFFHTFLGNVGTDTILEDLIHEKERNFYQPIKKMPIGSDKPVILYGRWCKQCGARKLDIYDSLRNERTDLLPITNFFCVVKDTNKASAKAESNVYITWTDTKSMAFAYSKLFMGDLDNNNRNGLDVSDLYKRYGNYKHYDSAANPEVEEIDSSLKGIYSYNEHQYNPVILPIEEDVLYLCYVINYDKFDNILSKSSVRFILKETPAFTNTVKHTAERFFINNFFTMETSSMETSSTDTASNNSSSNSDNTTTVETTNDLTIDKAKVKSAGSLVPIEEDTTYVTIDEKQIISAPVDHDLIISTVNHTPKISKIPGRTFTYRIDSHGEPLPDKLSKSRPFIKEPILPIDDLQVWQETILVKYGDQLNKNIFNNNRVLKPNTTLTGEHIDNNYLNVNYERETLPHRFVNLSINQIMEMANNGVDIEQCFFPVIDNDETSYLWRWVRKTVLVSKFTQRSNRTIIRRSMEDIPADIDSGLEFRFPFQEIEEDDQRSWYIKSFSLSRTYAKRIIEGFQLYKDVNYDSTPLQFQVKSLTVDCIQLTCKNYSRRVDLTWIDPYTNWSKTQIYIREWNGLPIWRTTDAKLILEIDEENKYRDRPLEIDGLVNGKDYQIGIFPVTKDGITIINPIQLVGKPRYIRPRHVIDEEFINKYQADVKKPVPDNINSDNDSNSSDGRNPLSIHEHVGYVGDIDHIVYGTKITGYRLPDKNNSNGCHEENIVNHDNLNKDIFLIKNKLSLGDFIWDIDKLKTHKSTLMWFETRYPLVEGGILTFEAYSTYPSVITVYSNHSNQFLMQISTDTLHWQQFSVEIPPIHYCKIIINIESKYSNLTFYLRNIILEYKTGSEKFFKF